MVVVGAAVEGGETTTGLEGPVAVVDPEVAVAIDEMLLICIILPLTPERMRLRLFFDRLIYFFRCISSDFCAYVTTRDVT